VETGLFMDKFDRKSAFDRFLPLGSALLVVCGLFLSEKFSSNTQYAAFAIAFLLVITWSLSEFGGAVKRKLSRSKLKLTQDQSTRLNVLLNDINDQFSTSCIHSPFYTWHNISNNYSDHIRMDCDYHGAINSWLVDLKGQFNDPAFDAITLAVSFSKAIAEANRLAGKVEKDLEKVFLLQECSDQDKKRLRKEWDSSKTRFNQWVSDWRGLFKELNHTHELNCVEYFRPLEMVA